MGGCGKVDGWMCGKVVGGCVGGWTCGKVVGWVCGRISGETRYPPPFPILSPPSAQR